MALSHPVRAYDDDDDDDDDDDGGALMIASGRGMTRAGTDETYYHVHSLSQLQSTDSFFREVFRDADDFFSNFQPGNLGNPFMPLVARTPGSLAAQPLSGLRVIPVDVLENDDSYVLRADLPGMKKEDVNVELDGQIVRISATKKDTKKWEEDGYKYHRAERRDTMEYSQRALRMPANTDFNKLEAGFDDGTLTVTFGKQKASTPTAKQITIQ